MSNTRETIGRRDFVRTMAAAAVGAAGAAGWAKWTKAAAPAAGQAGAFGKKVNLLWVTADDLNGDSMAWAGSPTGGEGSSPLKGVTPNLDEFASKAYGFAHCHAAAPICQPSRSAFMTGRVPHRNGALGFNPIRLDVPTMVESMAGAGYFTAGIQKLAHMAPPEKFRWDWTSNVEKGATGMAGVSPRNPKYYRNTVAAAIKAAADAGKPFFVNCNIIDPHRPFYQTPADQAQHGAKLAKEFGEADIVMPEFLKDMAAVPDVVKEVTQYYNSARRCDTSFGEALEALRESGQAENTIIVFNADHGMSVPLSKTTLFVNGTRTPVLFHYPGMNHTGWDREHVTSNVDTMPTLLELLAIEPPPGMDGRSLASVLRGEKDASRDHAFTHVNSISSGAQYPSRCVRTKTRAFTWNAWSDGTNRFHNEPMAGLTFNAMAAAAKDDPNIQNRVRQHLYRDVQEFYDLEKDPGERHNLIQDAAYTGEIEKMRGMLIEQMKKTDDPLLPLVDDQLIKGGKGHPFPNVGRNPNRAGKGKKGKKKAAAEE